MHVAMEKPEITDAGFVILADGREASLHGFNTKFAAGGTYFVSHVLAVRLR